MPESIASFARRSVSSWRRVSLPHDWAIEGPFTSGGGGGMGRLPSPGVAWYRRKLPISAADAGKSIFLDVDGAMSYATVWLNGKLVGGWPYGYASWRVDLTPYVVPGGDNQLAIRMDNPPDFSLRPLARANPSGLRIDSAAPLSRYSAASVCSSGRCPLP